MKNLLLIFVLLVSNIAIGGPIKFGNVTKEEVMEKQHPEESDAEAAILHKREFTTYDYNYNEGWSITREVHYRIKIYSKEGFSWATLQVPLYKTKSGKEKISSIKGITFNMEGDKLVSEKLKKDGIFEEEVNESRSKISITMPEVKEGSVIDIQFRILSPLFWYMPEYQFQYGIPVNQVKVKLKIPEYFYFKRYSKGFYPIQFSQTSAPRKLNVQYRTFEQDGYLAKTSNKMSTLEFKENIYDISAMNLPSMKEEDFTDNIDNYRTAIKFELSATQFPNTPYKYYSQSWEDVAKSIYNYSSFGAELNKSSYFEKDLQSLLGDITEKEEKIIKIFDFVKSKMTWNGELGVGCDEGVKDAYKKGIGNVAEINLMLTSMLRKAGINANPILVSTKSNGIPLFPTTEGFNYVITGIEVLNDVILLDATDKFATLDLLPERALNWYGRLVRKEGSSSQIELIPNELSKEIVMTNVTIDEFGDINGKTRMQRTGQYARSFRNEYRNMDEETYLEDLENQFSGIEVSEYEIRNKEVCTSPIVELCNLFKEGQCEISGDKMYVTPLLFYASTESPFKLENREYPINFTFPRQKKYMINIEIPEGYAVKTIPENKVLALPENLGTFKYMIKQIENKLQVVVSSEINTAVIPPEYYDLLKEYYKQLISKETERVVLVKS